MAQRAVESRSPTRLSVDPSEHPRCAVGLLHGEEEGQPISREQKEVIEGILAPDYDGRTVIELVQNGHDAHDRHRSDGSLELFLDEDEGDHGVLYVANGGNPITDENFTAMCRIAMSTKPPQEGIGNKGVGFKSVLQLTESPEVYSKSISGATGFDGYCFRFAKDDDFDVIAGRVAPERPRLAEDLRANVANLKLPVVLEDAPAGLSRFDKAEVATVLRVVLRSESARERVVEQFGVLTDAEVPVHLFLERVASISVQISGEDPLDLRLERREIERSRLGDAVVKRVEIQDGSRFLVLERPVAEASVKEAIAAGRTDTRLGSAWDAWEGDAWCRSRFRSTIRWSAAGSTRSSQWRHRPRRRSPLSSTHPSSLGSIGDISSRRSL